MPDFTKGKIYKITNDFNNDIYIGSTCNILTKRFSHHKAVISTEQQRPLYKLMAEIGFERFRIELIENYPCKDKYELRQREGHYIREMGTLNICVAGRTSKEYFETFRKENKEMIKENGQDYYLQNKEIINQKHQNYYHEHAEDIKKQKQEYRANLSQERKEEIKNHKKEKINCECGCTVARSDISKHKKTQKHIELMKQKEEK